MVFRKVSQAPAVYCRDEPEEHLPVAAEVGVGTVAGRQAKNRALWRPREEVGVLID